MSSRQRPAPCGSRHAVPGRRGSGTASSRVRTTVPQRFGLGRERGGWAQPVGTQPETLGDHRGVAGFGPGAGPGAGQHLAVAPGLDRVRADRNQRVAMPRTATPAATTRRLTAAEPFIAADQPAAVGPDRRPAGLAARPFAESNPAGGARYIFTAIATIRTQIFYSSPRAIVVAHNRIVPEMQDQVSLLTTMLATSKSPFMAAGTDSRAGA